jgi:Ca-activated chloride channel family protein
MNEHDSEIAPDPDELHDRLIDGALREVLGGESPPDLSGRILAAAGLPASLAIERAAVAAAPGESRKSSRWIWASFALAASLLVSIGLFAINRIDGLQEARVSPKRVSQVFTTPKSDRSESLSVRQPLERSLEVAEPELLLGYGGRRVEGRGQASEAAAKPTDKRLSLLKDLAEREKTPNSAAPARFGQVAARAPALAPPADGAAATDGVNQFAVVPDQNIGLPDMIDDLEALKEKSEVTGGENIVGYELPKLKADLSLYQSQLIELQKEHKEIEVLKDVALQSGRSPSALEAAVQAEVDADPMIANYQESLSEINQAIQQESAATRNPNDASLRALMAEKQQTEARMQQYRSQAAAEAREQLAKAPNEALRTAMAEYTVRANTIAARKAELEQKLKEAESRITEFASRDQYARIVENPFKTISRATTDNRLSTFSIDVDTASYANVRQFLMQSGTLPPPDAVRIEEMVNYFDYDYSGPTGDVPFAANVEVASCPWNGEHRLARIGIKGREMDRAKRPKSNLVFLIDVSGSMDEPAKLPLLVEGMRMLTRELGENDRVAIAVYASTEGLALESTPGTEQDKILDVLDRLGAGGSTAGGAGIQLAYNVATANFIKGGVNRVILCTDGDFNVGVTSTAELERLAEEKAKDTGVFLTVLGFGRGNLNDEMMEKIADKGNGNYHYVDTQKEARKVLVEEMSGTLVTIAKDVKIQVEFNPAKVAGYRLIGYENRVLAAEDFNDDKKDAGEIGAGHTVTALYEIVPAGQKVDAANVDELKYDAPAAVNVADVGTVPDRDGLGPAPADELLTLKIRYKEPDGERSTKLEFPIADSGEKFATASDDFKFASAVASFGMLLRGSQFKGDATFAGVKEIAESASRDRDPHGYRKEFAQMIDKARELAGE